MNYAFADYELNTEVYELYRAGRALRLEPKVFDVLTYLIEHRERMVSKHELLDRLWTGRVVSEATLSHCVMMARKAIGDDARTQRLIQTRYGRGYRFVGAVSVDD